eukprot:13075200-Ditylum_brightwellii.AAC.1
MEKTPIRRKNLLLMLPMVGRMRSKMVMERNILLRTSRHELLEVGLPSSGALQKRLVNDYYTG